MWVKISIVSQKEGEEPSVIATVNGSESDARNLHKLLEGYTVNGEGDDATVSYIGVQAEKRIPASPTYVPLEFDE